MTEKEWRMFNDILLEIYYAGSLETFGERCLKLIRILIPYTQGYFLVIDEDGRLDVAHSVFENVDPVMKRKYLDTYFAKDYLMQMCNFTKSMAYRDTDLLTDEKRRASVIYREYFKPQKLDMGCGLIIMKEGKTRVFLNLLRKCGEPDVTGHEMGILQTFLPHFEKNVFAYANHYVSGAADYFDGIEPLPEEYQMVKRRYSGFFGTDLEILLKGLGVEHIYAVGLLTDVCVHYTCADAHQHDYNIHVVREAAGGSSLAAHEAALAAIEYLQHGSVRKRCVNDEEKNNCDGICFDDGVKSVCWIGAILCCDG